MTIDWDEGVFYVRWWKHIDSKPSQQRFTSRKNTLAKSIEMQSIRSIVRVECLECIESSTRTVVRGQTTCQPQT